MPNIEALQQLRRVVMEAPEDRFNMARFESTISPDCGTARCAAGHAAYDPWHRENTAISGIFGETFDGLLMPLGRAEDTQLKLAEVYGITYVDSGRLFAFNTYLGYSKPSREIVAANIDRLIAGRRPGRYDNLKHMKVLQRAVDSVKR